MCIGRNFQPAEAKFWLFYQQLGDENPNFFPLAGFLFRFEPGARPKRAFFACVFWWSFVFACVRCSSELAEARFLLFFRKLGDENPNFSPARAFGARVALVYF